VTRPGDASVVPDPPRRRTRPTVEEVPVVPDAGRRTQGWLNDRCPSRSALRAAERSCLACHETRPGVRAARTGPGDTYDIFRKHRKVLPRPQSPAKAMSTCTRNLNAATRDQAALITVTVGVTGAGSTSQRSCSLGKSDSCEQWFSATVESILACDVVRSLGGLLTRRRITEDALRFSVPRE
jgi:hypothetical protein